MTYDIGFVMAQLAGHITNYHNLRQVAESDPLIEATWCEISYDRDGGQIEKMADRLGRGLPLRPIADLRRCLKGNQFDAFFVNANRTLACLKSIAGGQSVEGSSA